MSTDNWSIFLLIWVAEDTTSHYATVVWSCNVCLCSASDTTSGGALEPQRKFTPSETFTQRVMQMMIPVLKGRVNGLLEAVGCNFSDGVWDHGMFKFEWVCSLLRLRLLLPHQHVQALKQSPRSQNIWEHMRHTVLVLFFSFLFVRVSHVKSLFSASRIYPLICAYVFFADWLDSPRRVRLK